MIVDHPSPKNCNNNKEFTCNVGGANDRGAKLVAAGRA